jgi:hypothetical protein
MLVWGGDLHCAMLIGVVSGSSVSKYEVEINPTHKSGGWSGDGIRNCRLTVASVMGSVGDELLWMEIVKRISWQRLAVDKCRGIGETGSSQSKAVHGSSP